MFFSDISSPIIELIVIFALFYAAKHSKVQGRRVQIVWMLIALSVLFYFVGDVIWGVLELYLNQSPFPSLADAFYLSFYPLFALAIYFLPREPLKRSEELKIVLDMSIIILTVSLVFWSFLIFPNIGEGNDLLVGIISVGYVVGDIVLVFALIRMIFTKFINIHRGPLVLLGMGVLVQVISDSIYTYQNIQGTYVSGGLLDAGWMIGLILMALAAVLQVKSIRYDIRPFHRFEPMLEKMDFSIYFPLILVLLSYFLLLWASNNLLIANLIYVEIGIGIVIFLVLIRQGYTLIENKNLYLSAKKEIDHRKIIEKDLIESRKEFKSIFDKSPIGIFHSSPQGEFLLVNNAMVRIFHYDSKKDLIATINKKGIREIYVDKEKRDRIIKKALHDDEWQFLENDFYRKDGTIMTSELSFRAVRDDNGSVKYLEGFIMDITERKKADDDIKESLKEKELLLKEIHHRVKNNLQIITSMLDLQKYYIEQEETLNILSESQNRVKSMATIHEMLYQSPDLTSINFSEYIYSLISDIFYSYDVKPNIKAEFDVDEVYLNIETAIPCGLIINELVSNSIKYAFPHGKQGHIKIGFKEQEQNLLLNIKDDGIGFPEELDYKDIKTSLGLKLVNLLVEQIDGSIRMDSNRGTDFKIEFRELQYKKRF